MPALINPGNVQFSVINFLPHQECAGYSLKVAAKSAAGRRNPCNLTATQHAPGVFLCRSFDSPKIYGVVADCMFLFLRHIIRIMVVRAGSFRAGRYPLEPVFLPPSGLPPMSVGTPVVALPAI